MTEFTKDQLEYRAQQADRLLNHEPLLAEAMETVRMNALLALADVSPTDTSSILRYQAIAACTLELLNSLQAAIIAGGSQDGGLGDEATGAS